MVELLNGVMSGELNGICSDKELSIRYLEYYKMKPKKTKLVRIDPKTIIEIPIEKDVEKAKADFIRKRLEADKLILRWGNKK